MTNNEFIMEDEKDRRKGKAFKRKREEKNYTFQVFGSRPF
jgi:hypothetical protein